MSERKKRTWQQAYMDAVGTPVRAEDRSKKVNAWATKQKQKKKNSTRVNNDGNSGGHGF